MSAEKEAYEHALRMAAHAINMLKPDAVKADGVLNHFYEIELRVWFDCRQAVINLLSTVAP